MKTPILKTASILKQRFTMVLAALLATASLSSCEMSGCDSGDVKPDILPCNTLVTVVSVTCGGGEFQNRWLQLPNGELLQPFENQTQITSIKVGERYRIGYDIIKPTRLHGNQPLCQAIPPSADAIRLLCMTPETENTAACDTYVTATRVVCGVGAWGETWLKLDDGRYLQPWNNSTATLELTEGALYKIGYAPMTKDSRYNHLVVCQALPSDPMAQNPEVVSILCLEEVAVDATKSGN